MVLYRACLRAITRISLFCAAQPCTVCLKRQPCSQTHSELPAFRNTSHFLFVRHNMVQRQYVPCLTGGDMVLGTTASSLPSRPQRCGSTSVLSIAHTAPLVCPPGCSLRASQMLCPASQLFQANLLPVRTPGHHHCSAVSWLTLCLHKLGAQPFTQLD